MSFTPSTHLNKTNGDRDSNIELLRILAICGVIVLHYNNATVGGGFHDVMDGSLNQIVLYVFEGFFICAVDLFMLITGFYSCTSQKRTLTKVVILLIQVSIFRAIGYMTIADNFSVNEFFLQLLPVNYFVVLYVTVYLISPYVNLVLKSLSKKQLLKLLAVSIFLFSIWPTIVDILVVFTGKKNGLSTISMYGSDRGYTFVNFMLMYLAGACLRKLDVRVKKSYSAIVFFVCSLVLAVWGRGYPSIAWSYCNPIVILEAMAVFLLFRQIHLKSKTVNMLSKAAFTCFLFHTIILKEYKISYAVIQSVPYMVGHIIITCITIYFISFLVYKVWEIVSKPITQFLDYIFNELKIDFSVKTNNINNSK